MSFDESVRQKKAIELFLTKPVPGSVVCGCLGKRPGKPACPCAMRYVVEVDGYYYQLSESKYKSGLWTASNLGLVSSFASKDEWNGLQDHIKWSKDPICLNDDVNVVFGNKIDFECKNEE